MRYNEKGISLNLYEHIIFKPVESPLKYLDLPLPRNDKDLEYLTMFVFGMNIPLEEFIFTTEREGFQYAKLSFTDLKPEHYWEGDEILAKINYKVKKNAISYNDDTFNNVVHPDSNSEVEKIFWRTVFGNINFINWYGNKHRGTVHVKSVSEYVRLREWFKSRSIYKQESKLSYDFLTKLLKLEDLNRIALK